MMFFDALLYGLLAWYLDKTLPSEYGTQSPLYFPFLPSYWFGVRLSDTSCCKSNKKNYQVVGEEDDHFAGILDEREKRQTKKSLTERLLSPFYPVEESSSPQAAGTKISEKYFEAPSSELQQQVTDSKCLSVRGLRKVFKNAAGGDDRIAVNSLTMDMFQNQVTVLLG